MRCVLVGVLAALGSIASATGGHDHGAMIAIVGAVAAGLAASLASAPLKKNSLPIQLLLLTPLGMGVCG